MKAVYDKFKDKGKKKVEKVLKTKFESYESALDKAEVEILKKIKNISGIDLLKKTIEILSLKLKYDQKLERIIFRDNSFGTSEEYIPYGSLIKISYDNLENSKNILIDQEKEILDIISLVEGSYYLKGIIVPGIYGTMNYFYYENFEEKFSDLYKVSNLEIIPQVSLDYLEDLIIICFGDSIADIRDEYITIKEIIKYLKRNKRKIIFEYFDVDKFYKKSSKKISKGKMLKVIKNLTFNSENVLDSYLSYLFIKEDSKLIIPIRSLNIISMFNFLFLKKLEVDKNYSSWFGRNGVEKYLYTKLNENGIPFKKGEDPHTPKRYESDLILESENKIFIIELKKASANMNSRLGNVGNGILDIKKSLWESQVQALRMKNILKEETQLNLKDSLKDSIVFLEDREVYTLTLTLEDYGLFHNPDLSRELMKTLYSIEKIEIDGNASYFEKVIKEYVELTDKLGVYTEEKILDLTGTYYRSLFLNMEQFMIILNSSNGNIDDLLNKLSNLSSFYSNIDPYKNIKGAISIEDRTRI
ncbi:hypothetical protein [uncultured Ilyobacter sp.]|uniref:hypothetical protein n=1 Tax=uncultured Ilyobacter sp. TaxID=544433 RepID=UPI002AA650D5|nr:hypothetical protein [uncultured Ilyobacter sp.]